MLLAAEFPYIPFPLGYRKATFREKCLRQKTFLSIYFLYKVENIFRRWKDGNKQQPIYTHNNYYLLSKESIGLLLNKYSLKSSSLCCR